MINKIHENVKTRSAPPGWRRRTAGMGGAKVADIPDAYLVVGQKEAEAARLRRSRVASPAERDAVHGAVGLLFILIVRQDMMSNAGTGGQIHA
jgi:hypothetical protein